MSLEKLDEAPQINPKKAHIFSLGCVVHFVLTRGGYPFGPDKIKKSILIGESNLDAREIVLRDLVHQMLNPDPTERPGAELCLRHPLFWPANKNVGLWHLLREPLEHRNDLKHTCKVVLEPAVSGWVNVLIQNRPDCGDWDFVKKGRDHKPWSDWIQGRMTPFQFLTFVRNNACHPGFVVTVPTQWAGARDAGIPVSKQDIHVQIFPAALSSTCIGAKQIRVRVRTAEGSSIH